MDAAKKFVALIKEGKTSEAFDVIKAELYEQAETKISEIRKETQKQLGFEIVEQEDDKSEDDDDDKKDDDEEDESGEDE